MKDVLRLSLFICILISTMIVPLHGDSGSMLVVPHTPPDLGSPSPVLRFLFEGTAPLEELPELPAERFNDPAYAAFSADGELFVTNRHGNTSGIGSISRFTFDGNLNFAFNGTITGNSLNAVHGIAFSPSGELFAANATGGTISRFVFEDGHVVANGVINTGSPPGSQGLAFNQNGELFFSHWYGVIRRYTFDEAGQATQTGYFSVPINRPHGMAFSSQGELFASDYDGNRVLRFRVGSDDLTLNGQISVSGGPLGVAFSQQGELFVTCHGSGGIHRFLFDETGNVIPNGYIPTVRLGGPAILSVLLPLPNQSPVADAGGPYLAAVNQTITLNGSGSYDPDGDALTYLWVQADGLGSFNDETLQSPLLTGVTVGVTDLELWVSDGIEIAVDSTMLVVYDPSGGFVTGGGWINSPAGAYSPDPLLTGRANFGFVSKYKQGASAPTGQTEFVFQTAGLDFHSTSYDWFVVTGPNYARFKGTGTINGSGEYKFMLWAGDGAPDTFRIKIWQEDEFGVEYVAYDNGMDQPIDGGSIMIHTK